MKDEKIGWMAFDKNCTMTFKYSIFGGELIIRQIFSKRKDFWKAYPNTKASKVRITIEKI